MATKTCKDCQEVLPLSEFYGVQGECKACTKKRIRAREAKLALDPEWVIKDRARHREKSRRYRDAGRAKPQPSRRKINPEHKAANDIVSNAIRDGTLVRKPCCVCGKEDAQAHHEDYSKPLDVHWLCTRHHNDRHIHIKDCNTLKRIPPSIEEQFNL